jgi:hypothetical protein
MLRLTFVWALLLLPFAAHASPQFACYDSIVGYTAGPFEEDLTPDLGVGSVLFQGKLATPGKSVDDGLFLLLKDNACFYRYAVAPNPQGESYYPMQLAVPGVGSTFVAIQLIPGEEPSLTWSPAALPGLRYASTACEATDGPGGVSSVEGFLAAKIRSVTQSYQMNLMGCQANGHCRPKKAFIDALNACPEANLKPVIDGAIKQLKTMPECRCPQ